MKLTMLFAGGKKVSATEKAGYDNLTKAYVDEITKRMKLNLLDLAAYKAKDFSRIMMNAWRRENQSVFLTIASLLGAGGKINTEGAISAPVLETKANNLGGDLTAGMDRRDVLSIKPSGEIVWPRHKPATIKRKKDDARLYKTVKNDSANAYLYRTGKLRDFFRKNASSMGLRLGPPRISFRSEKSGRFLSTTDPKGKVGEIRIAFMTSAERNLLPGYISGDWTKFDESISFEKSLISDNDILEKLAGPDDAHRALVQPVVNYYLLYRYPRLVYSTLAKAMRM